MKLPPLNDARVYSSQDGPSDGPSTADIQGPLSASLPPSLATPVNSLLRRHSSAFADISVQTDNLPKTSEGKDLAFDIKCSMAFHAGFEPMDPLTEEKLRWWRRNTGRTILSVLLVVPLCHVLPGVFEPEDETARLLWAGFWLMLLTNTIMKRQNHTKFVALRDALFSTLSAKDAKAIKVSLQAMGLQFSGDSRRSYVGRHLISGLDLLIALLLIVFVWLSTPELLSDWRFWLSYCSWTAFGLVALKSASAVTFIIFHASSMAMERHSASFRAKTEEVIMTLHEEYEGGAKSMEEGAKHRSNFSAAMGTLMTEFSTLHSLSNSFNEAFQFYFLAAEFTIMPVVIIGMLLMAHKANQPLHTLNVFLICLVALYVIVYAACIPYLFSRACAVTEALRDVQRGIHLLRSDVFFFDQVKNVVVSSGGGGDAQAAATWRSQQVEKFYKFVCESELGFRPYGIVVDGRLALYMFYILATLAFTFYVEVLFN